MSLRARSWGRLTQRHRAKEFIDFLRQIDRSTPKQLALHLILDNSSTHKTRQAQQFLQQHPRFQFHFTPTSASWLNVVETWFSQLERRAIYRGVFTSVAQLRGEIRRYIQAHNELSAKPFRWTQSATSDHRCCRKGRIHIKKLAARDTRLEPLAGTHDLQIDFDLNARPDQRTRP